MEEMTVGAVSKLSGVTVRTLHHYDEIGLLTPSERSPSGYRLYGPDDLDRLQQILFYRELGFSLEAIADLLADDVDRLDHLERQRDLLAERIARLQQMAGAVDKELEARAMGTQLTPEEKFELFGPDYTEEWEAEAEREWGDTDAYKESARRTSKYTKADWERIKAEGSVVEDAFIAAMRDGVPSTSQAAMDIAEQHRLMLNKWFYDCSHEMHRGLAQTYIADPRFTDYYDKRAEGLASYVSAAIEANADRAG
jgi:DNA-binding transcriptional MerR regulator